MQKEWKSILDLGEKIKEDNKLLLGKNDETD